MWNENIWEEKKIQSEKYKCIWKENKPRNKWKLVIIENKSSGDLLAAD